MGLTRRYPLTDLRKQSLGNLRTSLAAFAKRQTELLRSYFQKNIHLMGRKYFGDEGRLEYLNSGSIIKFDEQVHHKYFAAFWRRFEEAAEEYQTGMMELKPGKPKGVLKTTLLFSKFYEACQKKIHTFRFTYSLEKKLRKYLRDVFQRLKKNRYGKIDLALKGLIDAEMADLETSVDNIIEEILKIGESPQINFHTVNETLNRHVLNIQRIFESQHPESYEAYRMMELAVWRLAVDKGMQGLTPDIIEQLKSRTYQLVCDMAALIRQQSGEDLPQLLKDYDAKFAEKTRPLDLEKNSDIAQLLRHRLESQASKPEFNLKYRFEKDTEGIIQKFIEGTLGLREAKTLITEVSDSLVKRSFPDRYGAGQSNEIGKQMEQLRKKVRSALETDFERSLLDHPTVALLGDTMDEVETLYLELKHNPRSTSTSARSTGDDLGVLIDTWADLWEQCLRLNQIEKSKKRDDQLPIIFPGESIESSKAQAQAFMEFLSHDFSTLDGKTGLKKFFTCALALDDVSQETVIEGLRYLRSKPELIRMLRGNLDIGSLYEELVLNLLYTDQPFWDEQEMLMMPLVKHGDRPMVGLPNFESSTCYINSLLKLIAGSDLCFQLDDEFLGQVDNKLAQNVLELVHMVHRLPRLPPVRFRDLVYKVLKHFKQSFGQHECVAEFIGKLFQELGSRACQVTVDDGDVQGVHYILSSPISFGNTDRLFREYWGTERRLVGEAPQFLWLHVSRRRLDDLISLDRSKFAFEDISATFTDGNVEYEPVGIIQHLGNVWDSGHYVAEINSMIHDDLKVLDQKMREMKPYKDMADYVALYRKK